MSRQLVSAATVEINGRSYPVHYYVQNTLRGARRFSCEVILGAGDLVILDDDSMPSLESRVMRLAPATVYSRLLAAGSSEAA
jgi:hypothetical protein